MGYKVFLVEDEIVTREGIRDIVDWEAAGFEFCGEAPDGEIALPLIEEIKPDVLITDIKMPFMDGLQLSKIVHKQMPWIKIIILSGHSEFEYAQSAIKFGVAEYLLKPVCAEDLLYVLEALSKTLDQEGQERENLKSLQKKVDENLSLSRERFLLRLVMGGVSSAEAIELSQQLGLDLVARFYLVALFRVDYCENSQLFDYREYQQVDHIITSLTENQDGVYLTRKDLEEFILLITGDNLEQLSLEGKSLADLIKNEVENQTTCSVVVEIGSIQNRLGGLHHSFAEALVRSKSEQRSLETSPANSGRIDFLKLDHAAIENYIKFGSTTDFNSFFLKTIRPVAEIALDSDLMKHYLFVDMILTVHQFFSDLGEDQEKLVLDVRKIENELEDIQSMEQIEAETRKIIINALDFRERTSHHERVFILQEAKAYLDENFSDTELKMNTVAEKFNISSSYFSTIFHQEFGVTFRDYLSEVRINHAMELLSSTNLMITQVAYRSGFNDSHYFSFVFKKRTGLTPREFRTRSHVD